MSRQYVVISLEEQRFCIPIELVNGIIDKFNITAVPNSRSYIQGVTNIRGDIVPVISLKAIFSLVDSKPGDAKLLNVFLSGKSIGFLVDKASQVVTVEEEDLTEMPKLAAASQAYFDRVAKIDEKLVIVLNPVELFDDEEKRELFALTEA